MMIVMMMMTETHVLALQFAMYSYRTFVGNQCNFFTTWLKLLYSFNIVMCSWHWVLTFDMNDIHNLWSITSHLQCIAVTWIARCAIVRDVSYVSMSCVSSASDNDGLHDTTVWQVRFKITAVIEWNYRHVMHIYIHSLMKNKIRVFETYTDWTMDIAGTSQQTKI